MLEYIEFISEANEKLDSNDIVPQLSFSTNGDDKVIKLHVEVGEIDLFADVYEGLYQDEEDEGKEVKELIKKRVLGNLEKIQKQINYVFEALTFSE